MIPEDKQKPDMYNKEVAKFDQLMEFALRTMPSACWSFYKSLTAQGFTEAQALDLTKAFLMNSTGR